LSGVSTTFGLRWFNCDSSKIYSRKCSTTLLNVGKNISEISAEDAPYLLDIFAVAQHLIKAKALVNYRITTNGPGFQDVTYLHFHLVTN
jgi:diadenosine tetraphosphate (Ap4A) HIT family hydrolase